jgi:hypothetical protein
MAAKLEYVVQHLEDVKSSLGLDESEDNVGHMADWLAGESITTSSEVLAVR